MPNDSYKEFAQIYDMLMVDVNYKSWVDFIINKIGKNDNKILEAACGTGSITCILSEKNYKITAFDLSEDMLMKAYEKLGRSNNVRLLNQDMISFKIDDKFDACICCCDGVNYLDENEIHSFLETVREHVKVNGTFIFDLSTEFKYETMYNDTCVYDDGKVFYVWENEFSQQDNSVDMEINFFVRNSKTQYERITEVQKQYIYSVDWMISKLRDMGFENIDVYGDYSAIPYSKTCLRAVFVCEC